MNNFFFGYLLGRSSNDNEQGSGCGALILGIVIISIIGSLITGFSSLLDKAQHGGFLHYALFPFIYGRGVKGSPVFWNSFFMEVISIIVISMCLHKLSKQISTKVRIFNLALIFYFIVLLVYKGIIGVFQSDSFLKVVLLIALPFTLSIVRGFIGGASTAMADSTENPRSSNVGLPIADPNEVFQHLPQLNLVQTGPERLMIDADPIREDEILYLPLFGASFYQREHLPRVCEVEMHKAFHSAGISVGIEVLSIKLAKDKTEFAVENLGDLLKVHDRLSIGDELIIQVLVSRETIQEKIQSLYVTIESHIRLVGDSSR